MAQTLVTVLEQHIARVRAGSINVHLVSTQAFSQLKEVKAPTISILLYQVREHAEMRNQSQTVRPDGTLRRQPLPLELCFLITPWGGRSGTTVAEDSVAASEEARILGLIMQAFYENSELATSDLFEDRVVEATWLPGDAVQVSLDTLPIEDHYRIWDASELGYRLSVTYRVRVVGLDPFDGKVAGVPVDEGTFGAEAHGG